MNDYLLIRHTIYKYYINQDILMLNSFRKNIRPRDTFNSTVAKTTVPQVKKKKTRGLYS